MDKSPDAFRTISEVADWLDTPAHVLRFWESRFTQVKPVKRAGGRRYYRPADMALLGGIKKLLHDDGMTIRGVQKLLREHGVKYVASLSPIIDGVAPVTAPAPVDAPIPSAPVPPAPMAEMVPQDDTPLGYGAESAAPPETVVPFARPDVRSEATPLSEPVSEPAVAEVPTEAPAPRAPDENIAADLPEDGDLSTERFAPHGFEPPAHVQEDSVDLPDVALEIPEAPLSDFADSYAAAAPDTEDQPQPDLIPASDPMTNPVADPVAESLFEMTAAPAPAAPEPPQDVLPGQAAFDFGMAPPAQDVKVEAEAEDLPPIAADEGHFATELRPVEADLPPAADAPEAPFVDVPEPMFDAAPAEIAPVESAEDITPPNLSADLPSDLPPEPEAAYGETEPQAAPLGAGLDLPEDLDDSATGITPPPGVLGQLNHRHLTALPAQELNALIARIETLRDRLAS
ncbi:MerR family transcriptional regulator [Celeribacter naphthalenivorans]|uniref:MerR family transcriptional regulator n=1 Tax=Celeribacter naphthalenivorans TaxID=1614694 RepID=UPI001CFA9C7E|nr:MerR family transcriptional regulator [Celeribacter naphthalenivorans]